MSGNHMIVIEKTGLFSVITTKSHDSDEPVDDFIPERNEDYKKLEYWDYRFSREDVYDWLGTYKDSEDALKAVGLPIGEEKQLEVLIVGCGNSTFSADLAVSSPSWNITSIDYSPIVIEKMAKKYPDLTWGVDDMMALKTFSDSSFDIVIEKAAMDALLTDAGSPWDPNPISCKNVDEMIMSCGRVLKKSGQFVLISFQPSLFRQAHIKRGMEYSEINGVTWNMEIKKQPVVNQTKGTEYTVYALERR